MENKKELWSKNNEYKPLRQPKMLAQRQNMLKVNTPTTMQNNIEKEYPTKLEELVANSSLKVDAPEFIPRFSESSQQISSSVQNRLKIHRSESDYKPTEKVENNPEYNSDCVDTESDLKRLRQIIITLTKDPGQFDNLLQIFMDTVLPYLEDIILLSEIVNILVNEVGHIHLNILHNFVDIFLLL